MHKLRFDAGQALAITAFDSHGAAAVHLADGAGEGHTYCIHFAAGGAIGRHRAGFDQLFLVIEGNGWAEDAAGDRTALAKGEGVVIRLGDLHAKGSDTGMVAVMIQLTSWSTVAGDA